MKAKIKKGAFVGQDFSCYEWPHHKSYDIDQLFEVSELDGEAGKNRVRLIADGFGLLSVPGKYGNGALYVKKEDLIFEEELKPCPSCGSRAIRDDETTRGVEGAIRCSECTFCALITDWQGGKTKSEAEQEAENNHYCLKVAKALESIYNWADFALQQKTLLSAEGLQKIKDMAAAGLGLKENED